MSLELSGVGCGSWSVSGKGIQPALHKKLSAALPPNHLLLRPQGEGFLHLVLPCMVLG